MICRLLTHRDKSSIYDTPGWYIKITDNLDSEKRLVSTNRFYYIIFVPEAGYAFGQSFSCSALPSFSFLADTTKVSVIGVLSFTAIPSLY